MEQKFIRTLRVITALLLLGWTGSALADPRIALVIGNSAYGTVTALDNPANDSRLISKKLEKMGFDVRLLTDSNQVEMKRAIAQFGRDLRQGGEETVGLFFYAGHGVQSFGSNYLLPVDVSLSDPADLDLMAVEARSVLHQMASARNKTNIVILDACRNNPFEELADMDDNGLAEMKAPTGTFLAYATNPGGVALDGDAGNSPFTQSLATHIEEPGMPIEQLFKTVRVDVLSQTRGLQTPWDTSSLTREFSFSPQQTPVPSFETEDLAWGAIKASEDPVQIMLFLRAFPDSRYADLARERLQQVMSNSFSKTLTDPEPAPEAPQVAVIQDPASEPAEVNDTERLMFDLAASDNTINAYKTYLDSYPGGAFANQASERVAALELEAQTVTRKAEAQAEPTASQPGEVVTLNGRLTFGNDRIRGKTIAELVRGTPHFPPIEGLPEAMWKDQTCSGCHQWTPEALCTQAQTYAANPSSEKVEKSHPYGGDFKVNLRSWAQGGCLE
ncbi:caspase family protein [Ruegeria hyattellae]|uniref:caspase family protein n=1 Tax=Ruegeria hyattellae TaxID=3233337 RepID=UPI00355B77B4